MFEEISGLARDPCVSPTEGKPRIGLEIGAEGSECSIWILSGHGRTAPNSLVAPKSLIKRDYRVAQHKLSIFEFLRSFRWLEWLRMFCLFQGLPRLRKCRHSLCSTLKYASKLFAGFPKATSCQTEFEWIFPWLLGLDQGRLPFCKECSFAVLDWEEASSHWMAWCYLKASNRSYRRTCTHLGSTWCCSARTLSLECTLEFFLALWNYDEFLDRLWSR